MVIYRLKIILAVEKLFAFIGSSRCWKVTLINRLIGENILETNGLRNDDKGRHTTTRREMFIIPDGGVVIDTPGMRELGIDNADLSKTFSDIDGFLLSVSLATLLILMSPNVQCRMP